MSTVWALGDYHRFATRHDLALRARAGRGCGIRPGQRVLDVAAGTGNVALRAAEEGADVIAFDLTPEQLEAGRREAEALGVEIDWVEADAQELPFADGAFDVVTSAAGAIFAPDHRATAAELQRVCRPGGTIGMINFTPEGMAGEFFAMFAPLRPRRPGSRPICGAASPTCESCSATACELDLLRREYVERGPGGPRGFADFYKETFGPVVAHLREPRRRPAARSSTASSLAFARALEHRPGRRTGGVPVEYLLIVGCKL